MTIAQEKDGEKGRAQLDAKFSKRCAISSLSYRRQNKWGEPLDYLDLYASGRLYIKKAHTEIRSLKNIYDPCSQLNSEDFQKIVRMAIEAEKIKIAIWDDGVDYNHPALAFRISRSDPGVDATDSEFNLPYRPYMDHGTHVAGIASAGDERIGIVPILAPNNWVRFDPIEADRALEYAHKNGARIINMSQYFGSDGRNWLKAAIRKYPDMLFVLIAGNDGKNVTAHSEESLGIPLFSAPNVIRVASVTSKNSSQLAETSNYGAEWVDIAAWGDNVVSTKAGGGETTKSGTSMAAPQIARTAARMLLVNPKLSPTQIIDIFQRTVDIHPDLAKKLRFSGVLNEDRAIEMARKTVIQK